MRSHPDSIGVVGDRGRFGAVLCRRAEAAGVRVLLRANTGGWVESGAAAVVIDISSASALATSISHSRQRNVPLLVGTSGLDERDVDALRRLGEDVAVCKVANFSAAHQMQRAALELWARCCAKLGARPTAHVVDRHPVTKKDRPSATALSLAQDWVNGGGDRPDIGSIRGGHAVADHSVDLTFEGESLSIVHSVRDRNAPAECALRMAAVLARKSAGYYESSVLFDELLGISRSPVRLHERSEQPPHDGIPNVRIL